MINPVKLFRTILILGVCLALPRMVQAQGSSLFTGSGTTRGGTGGISGSLTGQGFGSTTGGSSAGRTGSTGFGSSSGLGGSTGFGQSTGFGSTGMNAASNPFGTSGANQGMVGRNSGAFAGQSMANQTGTSGRGSSGTRNFNNTGSNRQNFNDNQSRNNQNERSTSAIRPRQKVGFEYAVKSPVMVASDFTARFTKISKKHPALAGVEVKVEDDMLVLTGKVKDADKRRLAGNLLRQEPGVRKFRNDLEIESDPTPEE